MKIPLRSFLFAFCYATLLLATSSTAAATTLLRMSLAQMSQTAKLIVRARCVESAAAWDAGEIWTFTSFDVDEAWKSSAPARITVRLLGGRVGNLTSNVSGIPRFRAGEEVVLFLDPTPRGDFTVVSWEQGTFRIRRDPRSGEVSVTQDTASFAAFDPVTRRFEADGIQSMPLDVLRARITAALHNATGVKQ
jgi:hypothetical protein